MARPPSLAKFSLFDLDHMLHSRQRDLKKLHRRRRELQKELDRFDRTIAAITGSNGRIPRRAGGRAHNERSLSDTIEQVLSTSSEPMSIGDIVERVEASGYRSSSANFRTLVNVTLFKDERFENAGRGSYLLKATPPKARKKRRPAPANKDKSRI